MVDYSEDLVLSLEVLRKGGSLLYPTDTIWGLGCDATSQKAVEHIYEIKDRPFQKSFVLLVDGLEMLTCYLKEIPANLKEIACFSEKPTTVIYDHPIGLPSCVCAADGSVAIRICQEPFVRELIGKFGKPIVSTSANISGKPSPAFYQQVDSILRKRVNYIVGYRQDDVTPSSPSRIIRLQQGRQIVIRP